VVRGVGTHALCALSLDAGSPRRCAQTVNKYFGYGDVARKCEFVQKIDTGIGPKCG